LTPFVLFCTQPPAREFILSAPRPRHAPLVESGQGLGALFRTFHFQNNRLDA
jgi:hypothetical protein